MESSKLGYWLQVGANVGILVGLIVVGIQLRQEHQLAFGALRADTFRIVTESQISLMGENTAPTFVKLHIG